MQKKLIPTILILSLILSGFLSLNAIRNMQGNARVVNYTGVVRGATQLLVKQEMAGKTNHALIQKLDGILNELQTGDGPNGLTRLDDETYQKQLQELEKDWAVIKEEIKEVRKSKDTAELLRLSEQYFQACDDAVKEAEIYTEQRVSSIMRILMVQILLCLAIVAFVAAITSRMRKRQQEMEKVEMENRKKSEALSLLAKQLQAPMNEISETLYIADLETYELYFLNEAGQRSFHTKDFYGRKCYEVLQGRTSPCPFCTNPQLDEGKIITWEFSNPISLRHYLLKDRLIEWEGRKARMEIAFDMTENEKEKQQLQNMLDAQNMIVRCVHHLYENQDVTSSIHAVLQAVGKFFTADCTYLISIDNQMPFANQEWCDAHIASRKQDFAKLPQAVIHHWLSAFSEKGSVIISDLAEINKLSEEEYQILQNHNIQRMVAVPLESNHQIIAVLGVDNPAKDMMQNITSMLQTLCYFIMLTIKRDQAEKKLAHLSYHDELTSFYNRNRYIEDVKHIAHSHQSVGVVYLDINGLKDINDKYGHARGDELIIEAALHMRRVFPQADIYRIGGDEFVIISTNLSQDVFQRQVRELRGSIKDQEMLKFALGSRWSPQADGINDFIAEADACMYEDKRVFYRNRQNTKRYRHYNDELLHLSDPNTLQAEIAMHHFHVYLQSKIRSTSGEAFGAEALIRYEDRDGTIISPGDFMPLLAEHHLISVIDYYIFERICMLIREWLDAYATIVPISVNLSRQTMIKATLLQDLLAICQKYEVAPSYLEIEISEHGDHLSDKDLITLIHELKHHGFRISLDDFGTEYANLALLSAAPFDVLKLDKSIINELDSNPRTQKIVTAIMKLCEELHITIIAEGIETLQQLQTLTSCGVTLVQGFYYSIPLPVDEYQRKYMHPKS